QPVAPAVTKQEQMAAEHILPGHLLGHRRQTVEPAAHVGFSSAQPDAQRRGVVQRLQTRQTKGGRGGHDNASTIRRSNAASKSRRTRATTPRGRSNSIGESASPPPPESPPAAAVSVAGSVVTSTNM